MRFQALLSKRIRVGLPLMMLALMGNPLAAQFREVVPQDGAPKLPSSLQPTRQQFMDRRAMEPIPQATTQQGVSLLPKREGVPTPAELPQSIPVPSAAQVNGNALPNLPLGASPVTPGTTLLPVPAVGAPMVPALVVNSATASNSAELPTVAAATAGTTAPTATQPDRELPMVTAPVAAAPLSESPASTTAADPVAAAVTVPAPATAANTPSETAGLAASSPVVSAATVPAATAAIESSSTPTIIAPVVNSNPFQSFHRPGAVSSGSAPAPRTLTVAMPLSFNQITPGASTLDTVVSSWGAAAKTLQEGDSQRLIYRAPGFRQVDVFSTGTTPTVGMVLVHLNEAMPLNQLVEQLQLQGIRTVEVKDEQGTPLGCGFPERGVLLTYAPGSTNQHVSHVSIEKISGELYRLRAESDLHHNYTESLADLDEAIRLNPQDGKPYWLQAEIYSLIGRSQDALQKIKMALSLSPENPLYQLTQARLGAGNGSLADAVAVTRRLAEDSEVPSLVRARAQYQLGNMVTLGPEPDMQGALTHHMKAIDLASGHIGAANAEVRRMAKDILVDAHLAVAQDIALGNFQRQREVVPKWLTRATELAERFITDDQGDETTRMEIYRTTLAVYSVLEGNFDASIATDEAIKEGQRLVGQAQDRHYQYQVERELSETLYHAAKIEHRCGRLETAQKYANNAIVLLEGGLANAQPSLFDRLMSGHLYYFAGSLYAVRSEDHTEAVRLYSKSLPNFDDEKLVEMVDTSAFGDIFVSMGVSFWETGEREKAIELTQAGGDLMQQAVDAGVMEATALAVPFGNLAAMHEQLGNTAEAKRFSEMMAQAEKPTTRR